MEAVNVPYDTTPQNLLNVGVDYFNVNTNNLESCVGCLGVLRPTQATEHNETNVNVKVSKEKNRVDMAKTIKMAGKIRR